jgi:hypothetical protein
MGRRKKKNEVQVAGLWKDTLRYPEMTKEKGLKGTNKGKSCVKHILGAGKTQFV